MGQVDRTDPVISFVSRSDIGRALKFLMVNNDLSVHEFWHTVPVSYSDYQHISTHVSGRSEYPTGCPIMNANNYICDKCE